MLVPAIIFLVCFSAGVVAASRWLPELAPGPVGGLAFFAVCGLIGAALGLIGLHSYWTVRFIEASGGHSLFSDQGNALAQGLISILFESGAIFGLAMVVYLLAPPAEEVTGENTPAGNAAAEPIG